MLAMALAASAPSAWAAPKRAAGAPRETRAAPETVFVKYTPPPVETRSVPEPTRPPRQYAFSGPTRDFSQAFGMYVGVYAAEVLGANPYTNLYWNLYPRGQSFFFEFGAGIGTVQSGFSESVFRTDGFFEYPFLATLDVLGGWSYTGLSRGEGRGGGLFPYFVAGITSVYQGGVPNVGGVLGFGNRMSVPFMSNGSRWVMNYGVRYHVYSHKFSSSPSLTQNFVVLIGVQKYY